MQNGEACDSLTPTKPNASYTAANKFNEVTKVQNRKAWGSLRQPTEVNISCGPGKRKRSNNKPFDHLVVLDLEWTCDNKKAIWPVSEVMQLPSVLVRMDGQNSFVVDEFNSYVKPTLNPKLTKFSVELTGIQQKTVDESPTLQIAVQRYRKWLEQHKLVDSDGEKIGSWTICTWSDADIGGQISREFKYKKIDIPGFLKEWINLKVYFTRHYKKSASGLKRCVESLGMQFEGRAHDGLVDCRNTAKIVLHMAQGTRIYPVFVFRRNTRGLDDNGNPWGGPNKKRGVQTNGNLKRRERDFINSNFGNS